MSVSRSIVTDNSQMGGIATTNWSHNPTLYSLLQVDGMDYFQSVLNTNIKNSYRNIPISWKLSMHVCLSHGIIYIIVKTNLSQ